MTVVLTTHRWMRQLLLVGSISDIGQNRQTGGGREVSAVDCPTLNAAVHQ